ncbi:hypothetical protein LguiB_016740 [Lonicera macranthoides]
MPLSVATIEPTTKKDDDDFGVFDMALSDDLFVGLENIAGPVDEYGFFDQFAENFDTISTKYLDHSIIEKESVKLKREKKESRKEREEKEKENQRYERDHQQPALKREQSV